MQAKRLAALLLLVPAGLAGQMREGPPTINVNATATVEREPDRANLSVAVESEATTAESASRANAGLMTRVIASLRDLGISGPAIQTTSIQVRPRYSNVREPGQDQPRIVGYTAVNMVQITIDSIPRTGEITDAVIAAGANRVSGITFELRDPDAARREALTAAMDRARAEAETVAAAAGGRLGPPIQIDVEPQPGMPINAMAMRAEMAPSPETPVERGQIRIAATVRVVYRLVQR